MGNLPKRARGTGSISETGNGFQAHIRLPDGEGKETRHTKRFKTYEEADTWLNNLLIQHQSGPARTSNTPVAETVADLLRIWLMSKYRDNKINGKPDIGTIREYDAICRTYIVPDLGNLSLKFIDETDIEHWQDNIASHVSSKTGEKLSPQRKKKIWLVIRQAYRFGTKKHLITHDPTAGIDGFSAEAVNPIERAMSDRDYGLFLDFVQEKGCQHYKGYCRLRWEMALFLGRRQGEVLGLAWEYVDLKREFIQIENRLKRRPWQHGCGKNPRTDEWNCGQEQGQYCDSKKDGGLILLKGTKGGISNKPMIPIGGLVDSFKAHKNAQDKERTKARRQETYDPLDPSHASLVFTQPDTQRAYNPRHDAELFEAILKACGVSRHYSVHMLRHTAGTRLSASTGGDLPIIKDILGHKSIHTSMLYISPDLKARQEALDKAMKDAGRPRKQTGKRQTPVAEEA